MGDEEEPAANAAMQRVAHIAARGTGGTKELQLPRSPSITLGTWAVTLGQALGVPHRDCWIDSIFLGSVREPYP